MDYAELVDLLDGTNTFDLYRLNDVINQMLDDPKRLIAIKRKLRLGQAIKYYLLSDGRLQQGIVVKVKTTRVVIRDDVDGRRWDVPLCAISLDDNSIVDMAPAMPAQEKLSKSDFRVKDNVGFSDKSGQDRYGKIVRLNKKTATIECDQLGTWRVSYALLHKVIEFDAD